MRASAQQAYSTNPGRGGAGWGGRWAGEWKGGGGGACVRAWVRARGVGGAGELRGAAAAAAAQQHALQPRRCPRGVALAHPAAWPAPRPAAPRPAAARRGHAARWSPTPRCTARSPARQTRSAAHAAGSARGWRWRRQGVGRCVRGRMRVGRVAASGVGRGGGGGAHAPGWSVAVGGARQQQPGVRGRPEGGQGRAASSS